MPPPGGHQTVIFSNFRARRNREGPATRFGNVFFYDSVTIPYTPLSLPLMMVETVTKFPARIPLKKNESSPLGRSWNQILKHDQTQPSASSGNSKSSNCNLLETAS